VRIMRRCNQNGIHFAGRDQFESTETAVPARIFSTAAGRDRRPPPSGTAKLSREIESACACPMFQGR
jgi:hypothetical protein